MMKELQCKKICSWWLKKRQNYEIKKVIEKDMLARRLKRSNAHDCAVWKLCCKKQPFLFPTWEISWDPGRWWAGACWESIIVTAFMSNCKWWDCRDCWKRFVSWNSLYRWLGPTVKLIRKQKFEDQQQKNKSVDERYQDQYTNKQDQSMCCVWKKSNNPCSESGPIEGEKTNRKLIFKLAKTKSIVISYICCLYPELSSDYFRNT